MSTSAPLPGTWIRRFHQADAPRLRLFCLPHAGGSASYYFPFSLETPSNIEVLALQYPGRQDRRREPCVEDLNELADLVLPELEPWLDRPFALLGHSMGASLAFEVARGLERGGHPPLALFASGRRAPSRVRQEHVHKLDDDLLIEDLKQLAGTDTRMLGDEELLRMILPALRSDYKAAETYRLRPGPRLTCPIVALVGRNDPQVNQEEAAAWADHTTGTFTLRVFDGGHFYLNDRMATVADLVTTVLDSAIPLAHR